MIRRVLIFSTLAFFGACGGCGSPAPTTGSLAIAVQTPSRVAPDITVKGPSGYQHTVSSSTTLTGLAPGAYTVLANTVDNIGPVVELQFDPTVTGSPANVAINQTADAGVSYGQRVGTGMFWFPRDDYRGILGFGYPELDGGYFDRPQVQTEMNFAPDSGTWPESIAFDHEGNMWISVDEEFIARIPASALDGGPLPYLQTLTSATVNDWYYDAGASLDGGAAILDAPYAMAFDPNGDLYVANCGRYYGIHRFGASQLATLFSADAGSSALIPEATILPDTAFDAGAFGTRNTFRCVYGIAFDSSGDLWAGAYGDHHVVRFAAPAGIHGVVRAEPATMIIDMADAGSDGGIFQSVPSPNGLAFDSSGNLWVANWNSTAPTMTISRFTAPRGIVGAQAPQPSALIESYDYRLHDGGVAHMLSSMAGIAFDESGSLWAANTGSGTLVRYPNPSSLNGYVAPYPDLIIESPPLRSGDCGNFGFNPSPANLPIYR